MLSRLRVILSVIIVVSCCAGSFLAAEPPVYSIKKTSSAPRIDGLLFENCWKEADRIHEFSRDLPQKPAELDTRAWLTYDDENLYIAVNALGQSPDTLKADVKEFDKRAIFKGDTIELFISPERNPKKYFQIVINPNGYYADCRHEIGVMHPNYAHDSHTRTASGRTKTSWTVEAAIPLNYLGLTDSINSNWRFNIVRNAVKRIEYTDKKGKKKQRQKIHSMTWAYTDGNYHKPWLFGMIQGPDGKPGFPDHWGLDNQKQLCTAMAAVVKSCDCYFKGCNGFYGFLPENCEVNGELGDCRNVAIPQYPSKADGFLRLYKNCGFEEYLDMADQLMDKLVKMMEETRDRDGRPWITWGHVEYRDGRVYGYGSGPPFGRQHSRKHQYNQSKVTFPVHHQDYVDAFGIGFWGISKIQDTLTPELKEKILKILDCVLDFYHRDYVLKEKGNVYYWRTDDFKPLKPKMPIPGPRWRKLGADVVYLILAYDNFGGKDSDKYIQSLKKFSEFYKSRRRKLYENVKDQSKGKQRRALWRFNYLDSRMLDAAYHLKGKHNDSTLYEWMHANLKDLPRYTTLPKVEFMLDGAMHWGESSTPLLRMFAEFNPELYKKFIERIFTYHLYPRGVCSNGYVAEPVNESVFPPLLDWAYEGWKKKAIKGPKLNQVTQKTYMILGHPDHLRTTEHWVYDIPVFDRQEPGWSATPFFGYIEKELGEGFYKNGIAQGFTASWGGDVSSSDEKYVRKYHDRRKWTAKNVFYQFTAPFQNHAEPFQYGRSHTFNLVNTIGHQNVIKNRLNKIKEEKLSTIEFAVTFPDVPEQMPCYALFDITDILFKKESHDNPTGYSVRNVLYRNKPAAFDVYKWLEYEKPTGSRDKARLVVLINAPGAGRKDKITVQLKKKNTEYFRAN